MPAGEGGSTTVTTNKLELRKTPKYLVLATNRIIASLTWGLLIMRVCLGLGVGEELHSVSTSHPTVPGISPLGYIVQAVLRGYPGCADSGCSAGLGTVPGVEVLL